MLVSKFKFHNSPYHEASGFRFLPASRDFGIIQADRAGTNHIFIPHNDKITDQSVFRTEPII